MINFVISFLKHPGCFLPRIHSRTDKIDTAYYGLTLYFLNLLLEFKNKKHIKTLATMKRMA